MIYSCRVQDAYALDWIYSGSGKDSNASISFSLHDSIGSKITLGPLQLKLIHVEQVTEFTASISSTATFASGLTTAEAGAIICCIGSDEFLGMTISFAGERMHVPFVSMRE